MKFLAKGARGKIIEDAKDKQETLLQTFQVKCRKNRDMKSYLNFHTKVQ